MQQQFTVAVRCVFLVWAGLISAEWAPLLGQNFVQKYAPQIAAIPRDADAPVDLLLVVRDQATFVAQIRQSGWPVQVLHTYEPGGILLVHTTAKVFWNQLLPLPGLLFADRGDATPREELPVPGQNLFVNQIHRLQANFPSWNGAGCTVSVKENGFDSTDIDLLGRVAPNLYGTTYQTSHAAIMASLIAGAGTSDMAGRGAAAGCRLASSDFIVLLPDDDTHYAAQHISIQNHSYGVAVENYYGPGALAYDQSVVIRPALLHVFSAGNRGDQASPSGPYQGLQGWASLTGNFKMAKNVLTVGAVDSFGNVVAYSSRGPAYDGRIKPDLVAFGQDGSSGAAAITSGTAAVMQQGYLEQNGAFPPAALIRALLLNSADDIVPPGPDFRSGFGNLNAFRAAQTLAERRYRTAVVVEQGLYSMQQQVPAGQARLQITLSWDDLPAAAGAPTALVNNLDLRLIGPDGTSIWYPWILRTTSNPDSLDMPAQQGLDSLNNVEQVTVYNPVPGSYTIQVLGQRVVDAAGQGFSLAFDWILADTFSWVFPLRQNPPVAGKEAILQWENSMPALTGRLEYCPVGAADCQLIDPAVDLGTRFYRWLVPALPGLAQLKMTAGNQSFLSDTVLIAPALRMAVGFNCPDSVLLFWDGVGQGMAYRIWGLGDRYLEPLFTTTDTSAVLDKNVFPQSHFAVAPWLEPGFEGLRSGAPDIATQGVDCYFRTLLAELNADHQASLRLLLGSTYGLESVTLEKLEQAGPLPIMTWDPPFDGTEFDAIDPNILPGINQYRAQIRTSAGGLLPSDTVLVYFAGQEGVRAFPNPVSAPGALQVIIPETEPGTRFALYNIMGQQVLEQELADDIVTQVALPALPAGIYTYTLLQNRRFTHSGKLQVKP